jgi:hypothetical protein
LFAENADIIPSYVNKGMSEKIRLNLWDGFHKSLLPFAKLLMNDENTHG